MNIVLIHVGKCGGATIRTTLHNNNSKYYSIKFYSIHTEVIKLKKNTKYVILLRNPVSRFISAFNWRYKLVILDKTQEDRFPNEKNVLEKYKNVNNLAENIEKYDDDYAEEYIHHIYEDINYYLSDFLQDCKKEDILGVITQENLDKDFKKIFKIDIENNLRVNEGDPSLSKKISYSGYKLLKKYLWKDYECINKLYKMGCLSEKQYNNLTNFSQYDD